MQGIFVNGLRVKSKRAIKEAIVNGTPHVDLEATSFFGNEYEGDVRNMPEGETIYFVGPNPHSDRRFYGTITRKGDKITVK